MVHLAIGDSRGDIDEFEELVLSAGARIVSLIRGKRQAPDPKYFVGLGKVEEIQSTILANKADLVIFDHPLSPAQERNLERFLKCRVVDRTGLILDIFAQHARSFEGKLQVELAQLQYLSTRLIRGWTHLERQRGGIGLRGPGETQLEVDRRLLRNRIESIKRTLDKVRSRRCQSRRVRKRAQINTVSLIGYTNVGKSTLFNQLTKAKVHVAGQLFATLDPTLRRIKLKQIGNIVLADTVGFIRNLPVSLINAFQATLQEVCEADLLLHVIDASDPLRHEKVVAVNNVLKEIGAEKIPQFNVCNKIDLLTGKFAHVDYDEQKKAKRVWLSAKMGEGIELLKDSIDAILSVELITQELHLKVDQANLRAHLYKLGSVIKEKEDTMGGWTLLIRLHQRDFNKLIKHIPVH